MHCQRKEAEELSIITKRMNLEKSFRRGMQLFSQTPCCFFVVEEKKSKAACKIIELFEGGGKKLE